ncbi:MAG: G5 domain-containing protein [Anaerolineae bacterium]|nr:G5 domain-containing protein [Anaerolineae bacterium]
MKYIFWLPLLLLLAGCQTQFSGKPVNLIDGDEHISLAPTSRIPAEIIAEAEIPFKSADRILVNGQIVDPTSPMDCKNCTLQIRRAVSLTLITPQGEAEIQTAALTVGEVLSDLGIQLYAADFIDPPAGRAATDQLKITYRPARELAIHVDGKIVSIRSAEEDVGRALAGAGIPLVGLDASQPAESEPLPADGQIRIIRVVEKIELEQTTIPYQVKYIPSNEVEVDQEEILVPGQTGLIVTQTKIRYEDGVEISRQVENERTVRQPKNETVGYGTKYVLKTAVVDGQKLEYWRAIQVYATSYSPCNSGADRCYPNTASGKPVKRGVIAVLRSWYNAMQGQAVYVPGYGYATIEDIGAGFPDKDWIDLGYTDAEYPGKSFWTTVYFLPPVPANTLWVLE